MLATYWNTVQSFNRDVRLVLFVNGTTGFSFMGIFIMLLNLYLLRLGYGPEFIGLIHAAGQVGFAVFSLPAGTLGSRFGSRRMTIVGLGLSVICFAILPLAELLPAPWQAGWLLATFVIAWLTGGLYLVNLYPFMMALTSPAERNYVFAVRQASIPLSVFIAMLTGGFLPGLLARLTGLSLDHPAPYRYGLIIAVIVLALGVLALIATREVTVERPTEAAEATSFRTVPIGLIGFMALVALLHAAGPNTAGVFFNVYLDTEFQVSPAWNGALSAAGQLLAIPVALITPLALTRWGKGHTIIGGIWGLAFSLLLLAFGPHWSLAGLGFIGTNVLYFFTAPALTVSQQEIVPPEWRATMSGAIVMTTGLGNAGMAFGGGYLITAFGYGSVFLTGAVLAALGALLFWIYSWVPRWVITRRAVASLN